MPQSHAGKLLIIGVLAVTGFVLVSVLAMLLMFAILF